MLKVHVLPALLKHLKKVFKYTKKVCRFSWRKVVLFAKKLHKATAVKLHIYLLGKWAWYKKWHDWKQHNHINVAIASVFAAIIAVVLFGAYLRTYALPDISSTWNFLNTSDYNVSPGAEISSGTARLKALNYTTDTNTKGLYHFDDNNGSTASDSSDANNPLSLTGSPSWGTGRMNGGLNLNGSSQYGSANDSSSLSMTGNNSLETNFKLNSNFSTSSNSNNPLIHKGSYGLYLNSRTGKLTYELANSSANTWSQIAGGDSSNQAINNSWDTGSKYPTKILTISTNVYVGLGIGLGDAEVYKYNGSTWTKLGGDGVNGSWNNNNFTTVTAMANNGNTLYVAVGGTAGFAEVWSCDTSTNCTSWTKIGSNLNWSSSSYGVSAMAFGGGNLYVSSGSAVNTVYKWNGSSWSTFTTLSSVSGPGITAMALSSNSGYMLIGFTNASNAGNIYYVTTADGAQTHVGGQVGATTYGWDSTHEYVKSIVLVGTTLYAGVGGNAFGDGEVWRYGGFAIWNQIGGDGYGTGGSNLAGSLWMENLTTDGTSLYVYSRFLYSSGAFKATTPTGTAASNGTGTVSWTAQTAVYLHDDQPTGMVYGNSHLYFGYGIGGVLYQDNYSTPIGGDLQAGSWSADGLGIVESLVSYKGSLYAGVGGASPSSTLAPGTGHIEKYTNGSWSVSYHKGAVNKDVYNWCGMTVYNGELYALWSGKNSGGISKTSDGVTWTDVTLRINNITQAIGSGSYSACSAMSVHNGKLYISNPNTNTVTTPTSTSGRAALYEYDSTASASDNVTLIADGNGSNSSWNDANYTGVRSMVSYKGDLYAGIGGSTSQGEVWKWNGSAWSLVGSSSQWGSGKYSIFTLTVYNGKLYTGVYSASADNAQMWSYDGTSWTKIGGDGLNSSWDTDYEGVISSVVYNGELYAGLGSTANDGEIWKYNGSTWTKVGGDGLSSSWASNVEYPRSLVVHGGKLMAGLGSTTDEDAQVWQYGNNGVVESTTSSWDTNWHHVAGTYDGTTMKLYVDGNLEASSNVSLSMPDNSQSLLVGKNLGSQESSVGESFFAGMIDETRISNSARSSFTTKPYSTTDETITLADPVRTSGVEHWDTWADNRTANGGTIKYRLSSDRGSTWLYWNGSDWVESSNTSQANDVSTINSHMVDFPVTFDGLQWQAVLKGDGTQQVKINGITAEATSDMVEPETNASSITAKKANGGSDLNEGDWTNGSSPYFSWDPANDSGSGIKGYCVYVGKDNTADPVTTKGLLGTSPVNAGGHCQFAVSANNLDLATAGYLATPLSSSNSSYYVRIKAIDNAGNVTSATAQFSFRFDNTPPSNPAFINAPFGFVADKEITLTWPSSSSGSALDANSGVKGMQYRINNTSWYGDSHSGSGDINDLLVDDGNYTTVDPPDFANLEEGVNTIYFRTWDEAGNVTTTYVTAALKVNTVGAPSEPLNLTVTPTTNTNNSFAFDWDAPTTFNGSVNNITYCYTINTLPSAGTCTLTQPGITNLSAGAYATQPGANTFYVVAKDETNVVNYATYSSVVFNANTSAPGLPLNTNISDVSLRATSNWRLAITWETPSDTGSGISSYKIYRSTDNDNFTQIGTSSSLSYVDAGLTQQKYYYKVKACDNANNCGAFGTIVNGLPTGKYTSPALLTDRPRVSDKTTHKARVNWSTDRDSDSRIAYGTKSGNYSKSEIAVSAQTTSHEIDLDNLSAGTTYYAIAKWTDIDGNIGTSQEFTFTTDEAPSLKEITTTSIGLNSATIKFTSKNASKVSVLYGKSESFGGVSTVNTSTTQSTYSINLANLEDGVKYFYKLVAYDSENFAYPGSTFSFTTPARPRISNLRFQPIVGEPTSTQSITWETNVPSNSSITYGPNGSEGTGDVQAKRVTEHKMIIRNLKDNTEYFVIAQSQDASGNVATSDRQVFKTALDTRPPKISEINVETSIRGSGAEARSQIVVSWRTDEPSTSQVGYTDGSNAKTFNSKTSEDSALSTEHIVIVSGLPTSRVYSVGPISKDKAGNQTIGETQNAIIGRASDSILAVVLESLRKVFGF